MRSSSVGRISFTNPVRISIFDKEDKSTIRNDQRKRTSKSKGSLAGDSHIPRPRVRSSSCGRASSSNKASYFKLSSKNSFCQPTTPVTPARTSIKLNLLNLAAASSGRYNPLQTGRSPSKELANSMCAKGPRKDTRPLTNKSCQTILLNKIDEFFRVNQCSVILNSNGSFKPITLKMFVDVSSFLLKLFEVKQELTITNYIEQLPQCAKKLHYPGVMTKSWLKTANAMHSWPYVLGWVGWLVEVCQVREMAFNMYQLETIPFMGTEEQAQNVRTEFMAYLDCYNAWNYEKSVEENELMEKYLRDIEIQHGVTDLDLIQMRRELDEQIYKLQIIKKESDKLDETIERLKDTLSCSRAKEAKQLSDISTEEECIKDMITERDQLKKKSDILNKQIQTDNTIREELISTVKNQPVSKAKKEEILNKCTEIENYMCEFNEHLKDYQKELYILDLDLASKHNNLNKAVLANNKEIFMYRDNDIDVNFDELKLPEKGLLDPQIMEILEEKIVAIKIFQESLMKQCNDEESLIRSDTTKLENLQEKIKSLLDDKKLKEEKSYVDKMKVEAKKEKTKFTEQIEILRNEIKEIQDTMPGIQAIDLEIKEAKDKFDAVFRRKTFLEQSAMQFFENFYQILGKHRKELYDHLIKHKKS